MGVDATKIGSDWASQRIKTYLNESHTQCIPINKSGEIITTLIDNSNIQSTVLE